MLEIPQSTRSVTLLAIFSLGLLPALPGAPPVLWERAFGDADSTGVALEVTRDGGCIVAGNTLTALGIPLLTRSTILFVRTDGEGRQIWTREVSDLEHRLARSVVETADGGFAAAGVVDQGDVEEGDVFILKMDARGEVLWERREGGPGRQSAHSIIEAAGGDLVVSGSWYLPDGTSDTFLLRADASGAVRWRKTFGDRGSDSGHAVLESPDGSLVVAGYTQPGPHSPTALHLLKTDSEGNLLWERRIGEGQNAAAESLAGTRDGGFLIGGRSYGAGPGGGSLYLVRADGQGNPLWERAFGGEFEDWGMDAVETSTGEVVAVGGTVSFSAADGTPRLYLVKVDAQGGKVWDQIYGEESAGAAVREAPDGGYLVCGSSLQPEPNPGMRIYLFKRPPGSAEEAEFTRGDANRDHAVDVSDAVSIINALFIGVPPFPACPDGADADDSGSIEITDAVHLLDFLFVAGPPPVQPFPEAGDDSTLDDLDCHL